jgi:hypothetical protein
MIYRRRKEYIKKNSIGQRTAFEKRYPTLYTDLCFRILDCRDCLATCYTFRSSYQLIAIYRARIIIYAQCLTRLICQNAKTPEFSPGHYLFIDLLESKPRPSITRVAYGIPHQCKAHGGEARSHTSPLEARLPIVLCGRLPYGQGLRKMNKDSQAYVTSKSISFQTFHSRFGLLAVPV